MSKYDGVFMSVLQEVGPERFFEECFSTMRRRTDLFSKSDVARNMCMTQLDKHISQYNEEKMREEKVAAKKREKDEAEKKKRDEAAAAKKLAEQKEKPVAQVEDNENCCEVTEEEALRIEQEEKAKKEGKPLPAKEEKKDGDDEDDENKGIKPNSSNGADLKDYNWGQTLSEVTVNIYLPDGIKSKDLTVVMRPTKCSIKIKNGATLLEGTWFKPILEDDSLWCIESDNTGRRILQLNLSKKTGQNWWDSVLEGQEKINTQKVEPENSKLSDLDNETRSVVEKMMFDQRQKQAGLPSSDEMEKRNKLDQFMAAHPEMDFSKAKFS